MKKNLDITRQFFTKSAIGFDLAHFLVRSVFRNDHEILFKLIKAHHFFWQTIFEHHFLMKKMYRFNQKTRPGNNIRMYWTNFRQPTAPIQQNIFGKTSIEACSLHLYASFGTFYVKIDQLLEAQWVFEVCLKIDN